MEKKGKAGEEETWKCGQQKAYKVAHSGDFICLTVPWCRGAEGSTLALSFLLTRLSDGRLDF